MMNTQHTFKVDHRNLLAIDLLEKLGSSMPTQDQIDYVEKLLLKILANLGPERQ